MRENNIGRLGRECEIQFKDEWCWKHTIFNLGVLSALEMCTIWVCRLGVV